MQLRMSPGGSMLKSWRKRPDEPPSSVTVTTAARSEMWQGLGCRPVRKRHVTAESAEQGGEPGASADGDDAERCGGNAGRLLTGSDAPGRVGMEFVREPGVTECLRAR